MEKAAAFTVIELLIVIAIISIIAAIAVPNIMSANIRAKVSGAKADMGSIAIALEDYKVDYGKYPQDPRFSRSTSYALDIIAESGQDFDGKAGTDDDNDAIGLGYLVYPKASYEPTYLKRIAGDPFDNNGEEDWDGSSGAHNHHYLYYTGKWDSVSGTSIDCASSTDSPQYWGLASYGPDKDKDITSYVNVKNAVNNGTSLYNPDNGITSDGDIVIIGP